MVFFFGIPAPSLFFFNESEDCYVEEIMKLSLSRKPFVAAWGARFAEFPVAGIAVTISPSQVAAASGNLPQNSGSLRVNWVNDLLLDGVPQKRLFHQIPISRPLLKQQINLKSFPQMFFWGCQNRKIALEVVKKWLGFCGVAKANTCYLPPVAR